MRVARQAAPRRLCLPDPAPNPQIRRRAHLEGRTYIVDRMVFAGATARLKEPPDRKGADRSEEHTSELQSLMRISYAVFCLTKKNTQPQATKYNESPALNTKTISQHY